MDETLDELRSELDAIDRSILQSLARRKRVVERTARAKVREKRPVRDPEREAELLEALRAYGLQEGLDEGLVGDLYGHILEESVRWQSALVSPEGGATPVRVAYQGSSGAFSELAAERHFASRGRRVACTGLPTFRAVLAAVENGDAEYGMLPVENTTAGSVNEAYDLLTGHRIHAVGEEVLRVRHTLVALEPVEPGRLRRVLSHPQALAQCSRFLEGLPGCVAQSWPDTAMAVEKVLADGDPSQGAIASAEAAERNGLHVIARDLANQPENYTRFLVVGRQPRIPPAGEVAKTSIVLATRHRPAALVGCLQILAGEELNLTKLESRPRQRNPFEYLFYVDFEGNTRDAPVARALAALAERASYLKVIGCYEPARLTRGSARRAERPGRAESPGRSASAAGKRGAGARPTVTATETAGGPHRLVGRTEDRGDTVVQVGTARFGGDTPVLIGGPCSVESRAQIHRCARAVRQAGGHMLRGGCYKPRTSPYSFQGLGDAGVDLLVEAGRATGLPVVTEVLHPADVERIAERVDMLQIGTRNMQNYRLLEAVGRTGTPVLLKRGMSASVEEWLSAAEHVLAQGNQQVVLCERGIRTFERATRATLDLTIVPVVRERTHLPVIVDPSHACGQRRWVPALARAALAAGAHGLIIEAHPEPENARSDGAQSLTLEAFAELAAELVDGAAAVAV